MSVYREINRLKTPQGARSLPNTGVSGDVPTVELFGLEMSALDTAGTVALLIEAAKGKTPFLATYVNPHTVNQARHDVTFAEELRHFDLSYADGIGIVWASRVNGRPLPERVTATDFLPDFCRSAAASEVSVYLLGGKPGVAEQARDRLCSAAPGLKVVGCRDGFFGSADAEAVAAEVRRARPDVCVVAMGSPRQERWILANANSLGVPLLWAVGGAFDFHAGLKPRAPRWLIKLGLEWAFRMALEPGRLGTRYIYGNAMFAWATFREAIRSRRAQR